MKLRTSHHSFPTAFLVLLCLTLGAIGLIPDVALIPASAQQPECPEMNIGGNTSLTWPPGATVKVFFDDSVSPDRMEIYKQALNNWTNGNCQGVAFVFEVSTGQAQYSMSISDAVPNGDNSLRGMVTYQQWDGNGALQFVDIQMNPNVTNPTALLNAMSHEISHNFGLNHLASGSSSNQTAGSLYNSSNGLNDTTTGAPGPTDCDRYAINSTYAGGGVRYVAPLIVPGTGGGEGGGYDPYYYGYSCTPYYWVLYQSWDGGETWFVMDSWYAGCW